MPPVKGLATLLKIGDGASSEAFNTLVKMRSASISKDIDNIDTSSFDNTDWRSYLAGLQSGSLSFSGLFVPTDTYHKAAETDALAGTDRNFELHLSDGSKWAFSALFSNITHDSAYEDAVQLSGTLTITAKPVYTASA